jgi:type II secretory pathway pseudopilin PulG
MLTVIGIIVLLVSILLPVVSAVRTKGAQARTQAQLQSIASGIQSYYGDFAAYPGPLHNSQVHTSGMLPKNTGGSIDLSRVTMAENLTLGLLGGLYVDASNAVRYNPDLVGSGPMGLNLRNPKKFKAYMDKANLSPFDPSTQSYHYVDEASLPDGANDTDLAEFVDTFPDGMPILYLRAKQGAPNLAGNPNAPSVWVTNTTNYVQQGQYDLNQVIGYTNTKIGVGKETSVVKEFIPAAPPGPGGRDPLPYHGLKTADPTKTVNQGAQRPPGDGSTYTYPYDLNAFMRHPTLAGACKQQDGYFLISAGADRIYGTKDDITFPAGR